MIGKIGVLVLMLMLIGATATTLSGCGGGGCRDNVTFTWTLKDSANNVFHCEDIGATTVVINMGGMTAPFACNAYAGTTASIHTGTYATAFQLQDASGNVLSQLDPQDVTIEGCGTVDLGQVDFPITPPPPPVCAPRSVSLTWSIVRDATNAPLTCDQANARTVELNLGGTIFDFACGASAGVTTEVPAGSYATSVVLLDPSAKVLSGVGTMNPMDVVVPPCGNLQLPNIIFPVN